MRKNGLVEWRLEKNLFLLNMLFWTKTLDKYSKLEKGYLIWRFQIPANVGNI